MVREKQSVACRKNFAQRLEFVVWMKLSIWQLLLIASAVGVFWAATLFDWSFISGRHAFWQFPRGTIGGSDDDMAGVLVGYLYYIQSPWHLPLFYVPVLGTPAGTNVIFLDVVPIIAFIGKVVHGLTGATINLYGGYLFLCFVLPGVMTTLVLIAARVRYAFAVIIAAIFANASPTLLWRWGHIALKLHYLLIGALALYLFSLKTACLARGCDCLDWLSYSDLSDQHVSLCDGRHRLALRRYSATSKWARHDAGSDRIGALTIALVMT